MAEALIRLTLYFAVLALSPVTTISQNWRDTVPLHSSRVDVEWIPGAPPGSGKYVSSYELEDEVIDVVYASGPPCGTRLMDSWRVPPDTVVEDVISTYYLPQEKDRSMKGSASVSARDEIPVFERYGNVSSSMEKAILDNFAIQLQLNKQLRGYVVVYVSQAKKAPMKIRYILNYLMRERAVPRERVTAINGGQLSEGVVELYLVPRGKPGPKLKQLRFPANTTIRS